MKKILLTIVFLMIGIGVYYAFPNSDRPVKMSDEQPAQILPGFDAKNSSFTIENAPVNLADGLHVVSPASIPTAKITTRYFGNEASGDLNFDGRDDVAFLVTQDGGGSGTFYYVVAAINTGSGYRTTNAFLIGDRIAPQSTEIKSQTGELRVNFAKRKDGEPMTAAPSVGAVLLLKVTPDGVLEGLMK